MDADMELDPNLTTMAGEALSQLPAPIRDGAFKAIGRLIGAATSVPEAYLKRWSQRVNNQTEAEAAVWKKLAGQIGERVAGDEQLLDRATATLLGETYRKQVNREEVAREAVLLLSDGSSEASPASEGPTDDWMNVFVGYAERASSEGLRTMWARVLAGEIRTPGEFSLITIRFISELDSSIAKKFEDIVPNIFGDFIIYENDDRRDITNLLHLEDAGLLNGAAGGLRKRLQLTDQGVLTWVERSLSEGGYTVWLKGTPGQEVHVPAAILTRVGREVLKILPRDRTGRSARGLANHLATQGFQEVKLLNWAPTDPPTLISAETIHPIN